MKLRITDLTEAGIDVTGELAAESLNERLNSESDSGILFSKPVLVTMRARRTVGGAELSGTLSGSFQQGCGRCLEGVSRDFSIPSTFVIKPRNKGEPKELADDVGVLYFSGEHCELESPLQESVILSMSLYWSPEINQNGHCVTCHKNCALESDNNFDEGTASTAQATTQKTTRLGDLLKQLK